MPISVIEAFGLDAEDFIESSLDNIVSETKVNGRVHHDKLSGRESPTGSLALQPGAVMKSSPLSSGTTLVRNLTAASQASKLQLATREPQAVADASLPTGR